MSHYRPHSRFDTDRLNASRDSADRAVGRLEHLPYAEKRAAIRRLLCDIGIDVARDDADPGGDGDQRPIATVEGRDIGEYLRLCVSAISSALTRIIETIQRDTSLRQGGTSTSVSTAATCHHLP